MGDLGGDEEKLRTAAKSPGAEREEEEEGASD